MKLDWRAWPERKGWWIGWIIFACWVAGYTAAVLDRTLSFAWDWLACLLIGVALGMVTGWMFHRLERIARRHAIEDCEQAIEYVFRKQGVTLGVSVEID